MEKSSLSERERLVVGALPRDGPPRLDGSRQLPPVEPLTLPPGLGKGKGKLEEPKSAPLRVGGDPYPCRKRSHSAPLLTVPSRVFLSVSAIAPLFSKVACG